MAAQATLEVLEFFSGIGGMRAAVSQAAGGECRFQAFDTSDVVNAVYEHNAQAALGGLHAGPVRRVNVETVALREVEGAAEMWTMSPPCQPFTQTMRAKQLDLEDKRNKGLLHLMALLQRMERRPRWIVLENVKAFSGSDTHAKWLEALTACGYRWRQYLLSPLQFRIPNNRMRFYMVCLLDPQALSSEREPEARREHARAAWPRFSRDAKLVFGAVRRCACEAVQRIDVGGQSLAVDMNDDLRDAPLHKLHELGEADISGPPGTHALAAFLEQDADEQLLVSDAKLRKRWAQGLSYVGKEDRCTFCFTSSYGATWNKSSGSLLHTECHRGKRLERSEDMSANAGKVRLFSPRELLNLFAFPPAVGFPADMPLRQRLRVVGQSVNVAVVRALVHANLCPAALAAPDPAPSEVAVAPPAAPASGPAPAADLSRRAKRPRVASGAEKSP